MQTWSKVFAFALLAQQALAYPSPPLPLNVTDGWTGPSISRRQNSNLPDLRILPLGASITYGLESTDGNGYRKYLRDQLRFIGYEVNMVGSQRPKGMNDNDNEGHSGFTVQQVHGMVKPQYRVKPNLVLINAGTNDCRIEDIDAERDSAGWMEEMVIDIFNNIPEVTVILSGLLPNRAFDDCNKALNDQYNALVNKLAGQGRKIVFADLHNGWFTFEDLIDGTHPNDFGYKKMASVWYDAFQRAVVQEFITPPLDNDLPEGATTAVCDKHPGEYEFSAQTQQGSGADDGPYKHEGISQGYAFTVSSIREDLLGKTIFWADLDGDGRDELIWYYNPIEAKGYYMVYFDWENGDNTAWTVINVNDMCNPEGVHWGDVDADGLDDFICIGKEGNMYVSLNKGGVIPQFQYHGLYHKNPRPSDTSQANVRLGDMDGDGRLDYCLVLGNGDIYCWRNGGDMGDVSNYWERMYKVFTGKDKGNIAGVHLVDINGDHRYDWLYVHDDGSVETYINNRGHDKSIKPDWSHIGKTHAGMEEEGTRGYIQFARLTHSGRADYIWQNPRVINDRLNTYAVDLHWWRNNGHGGTKLKADGNNYCDMDGDGLDDYIWVSSDGNFYLYRNLNNPPQWHDHGLVFEKKWDRQFIRIADIDGDGKCDLIFLNEGGSGEVVNWFKTDFKDGRWSFRNQYELEQVGACRGEKQRNGVGLFDLAVRFADLNGDKKADRLCIDPNGRTFAMVSQPDGSYKDMGQVKKPENKERANLRFVDVNGDGRADMVWLHKYGGNAQVWYNVNEEPAAGSSMTWRPGGDAYQQSARGDCIHFGDLRGSGRMDMIDATPRTNEATTWFSKPCAGGGSGDDGLIHDPNLPKINEEQGDVPFPQFPRFIVLGDSYSAGIGAGAAVADDRWDENGWCHRNQGAYSHLLWQRDDILRDRAMEFISCTGAKAENLLTNKQHSYRPGPQLDMLKTLPADSYGWGTLSLGGNDIGFTPIIFACLLGDFEDACEDAIANAQRLIDGTELEERLIEVYTRILEIAQTPDFTLIVTGYAQFFNEVTDLCDSKSLALLDPLPIFRPPLVKAIRARLNALVRGINAVIDRTVEAVNKRYVDKHIQYFSIDGLFDTHRLCDADPTTGHDNEGWRNDAWFYTLVRNTDPLPAGRITSLQAAQESDDVADLGYVDLSDCPAEGTEEDTDFGIACMLLRQIYANQEEPGTGTPPRGSPLADVLGFFFKSFHPKQQAHDAIAKGIKDRWGKSWGKWGPVSQS